MGQPPSGGCVLKRYSQESPQLRNSQPPSGGCVLKLQAAAQQRTGINQPPSGGCVLKPYRQTAFVLSQKPAAFGRLCVET